MKTSVPTSAGVFHAEFRGRKLSALHFPNGLVAASVSERTGRPLAPACGDERLREELEQYLRGQRRTFSVPVALEAGTPFQRKVWRELQRIPYGATRSYGDIARAIGALGAARAVGAACGRNPIPILVPCHRVVAHDGGLGGFSAGLGWKKRLLNLETASARVHGRKTRRP